jgi:hypothetical protein
MRLKRRKKKKQAENSKRKKMGQTKNKRLYTTSLSNCVQFMSMSICLMSRQTENVSGIDIDEFLSKKNKD